MEQIVNDAIKEAKYMLKRGYQVTLTFRDDYVGLTAERLFTVEPLLGKAPESELERNHD